MTPRRKAKLTASPRVPRFPIGPGALGFASRRRHVTPNEPATVFNLPSFPPSARPASAALAMDGVNDLTVLGGWGNAQASIYSEGLTFMGFAYLSELMQRPEYRVIAETLAGEMTRKWIRLNSSGTDDRAKDEKIKQLDAEMKRLNVRDRFKRCAELDGGFGRAHLFIDTGDVENTSELATDLGDGWNDTSKAKVNKDKPIKQLKVVEPVWVYPQNYNSTNPLTDDWFKPQKWMVQGVLVHCTRLLTFIGREVPDLLKPTYAFGGLSMVQMAKPYVDNWLKTRQGVQNIITSFSVFALLTNLGESLQADGQQLFERAELFNRYRDNQGLMMLDKDSEDFRNVSAPLGGLHELQAQAQEHMCSVSRTPAIKLIGIQPSGMNASSEGELRSFYDYVKSWQEHLFRHKLKSVLGFIMLSLWGEVDPDIDFDFIDLWALDEKGKAELDKTNAETDQILIDAGVLHPEEARKRVAAAPDSGYASIDVEDVPDLLEEEEQGLEPEGGRPDPDAAEVGEEKDGDKPPPASGGGGKGKPKPKPKPKGAQDETWHEGDHPRGQPDNAGQFASTGGGARAAHQPTKVVEGHRVAASGEALPDHIRALKIPPGWADVTYNPDPKAPLQATGKDAKGRLQAIYSADHTMRQAAAKFARISDLDRKFDGVFSENEEARRSKDPRQRAAADCARLIMMTGIRPGSESDTGADKQAFGATTLEGRHVIVDGPFVTLKFVGKKGVDLSIPVEDHDTAKMLIARKRAAGAGGQLFPITEGQLLEHVHSFDGGGFRTKDMRTLLGTRTAMSEVSKMAAPATEKAYKAAVKAVATKVSERLGNTPTVALQSYISPTVFAAWRMAA